MQAGGERCSETRDATWQNARSARTRIDEPTLPIAFEGIRARSEAEGGTELAFFWDSAGEKELPLPADGGLPFEAARFDTVAVTWTLCTIPDVASALREMRRVLRPDGALLFIEHGRSDEARVARWQDRLNPIQNWIGCGCNLNRAIDRLVGDAGFTIKRLDRFVMDGTPQIVGTMYRGVATP